MAYKSLNDFVNRLEKENELIRIKEFVNTEYEITEIVDRISKNENNKAILFENTGTNFPVLINFMGTEKRMSLSLGVDNLDKIGKEIEGLFSELMLPRLNIIEKLKFLPKLKAISQWLPKLSSGKGKCQEVISKSPNINMLPVLKCWPEDGGKFITLPIVITKDPNNAIRNVGMYRMQIFKKDLTGMHWHKHKVGARHYIEYKKITKKIPIAVALGGDPAYTYSATAPLPDNVDEFILAGFLRKKRVELVKCITQDIEVPSDVDIVIEGYIDPQEELIWEGPFGDHTGFYSLADWYPKFHITCITHKKNAIYPATIVGIPPMEDAWIGKATERIFLAPLKIAIVPEIIDYNLPFEGVAHNIAIVKIKKEFPGQALKVMNALWGAGQMMFNKIMIIVDEEVDIYNYKKLLPQLIEKVEVDEDIYYTKGPLDVLDHSASKSTFGSKIGIDATSKLPEEKTIKSENKNINNFIEDKFLTEFPEIYKSNYLPVFKLLIISVKKNKQYNEIKKKLFDYEVFGEVGFVVIVDFNVDVTNLSMITWIASGNIDPKRDTEIKFSDESKKTILFIDATRKNLIYDGFERDWPNVVISNDETINSIDLKWEKFGLGEFIKSPSLEYKKLNNNRGAIAKN